MRLIAIGLAVGISFLGLISAPARATSVLLNNGTFTDAGLASLFQDFGNTFSPIAPATLSAAPVAFAFPIDPSSTATFDTVTGKFAGVLKLLGGVTYKDSAATASDTATSLSIDLSPANPSFGAPLSASISGAEPAFVFLAYQFNTPSIVGNILTGNGTEVGNPVSPSDPTFQFEVSTTTTAIPLPPALGTGGITIAMLGVVSAMRSRRKC